MGWGFQQFDPAWLLSAIAQSSAALVGLIGGIVGAQLFSHLSKLNQYKNKLRKEKIWPIVVQVNNVKDAITYLANRFEEQKADAIRFSAKEQEEMSYSPTWHFLKGRHGSTKKDHPVHVKEDLIIIEKKAKDIRDNFPAFKGNISINDNERIKERLEEFKEKDDDEYPISAKDVHETKKSFHVVLEKIIDDLSDLNELLNIYYDLLIPRRFIYLFIILIILSIVGIIYPLWFLTTLSSSIPNFTFFHNLDVVFFFFFFGISAIIGFFGI